MTDTARSPAFPMAFALAFAIAYVIAVENNLALFTYHPAIGEWGLGVEASRDGPAMYWYGWLASSSIAAWLVGLAARFLPRPAKTYWSGWVWVIPLLTMLMFVWILRGYFLR
ncbi:MAG: hypothetical protein ACKVQK_27275 [Burkholderiales bacterium]